MFAVLLMMAVVLFTAARYLIRLNKRHVPKGDFVFDRFEYFVFALFLPAVYGVLFVIEELDDTLGVRKRVGSYTYWLVGGVCLVVFTVLLHELIRLRRP